MEYSITKQEYDDIRTLLYDEGGISLGEHKQPLVVSRLTKRLRDLEFDNFASYYAYVTQDGSGELGAVDFITKPKLDVREGMAEVAQDLIEKIKAAAIARIGSARPNQQPQTGHLTLPTSGGAMIKTTDMIIAIGSSTGGTEAVKNYHMTLVRNGARYSVHINQDEPMNRHRPSVDVMFDSVAKHAGRNAVGIIMTGMGGDGAKGLLAMKQAGAHTIAQNEASCVEFGMPKEAIKLGAADAIVSLVDIPSAILTHVSRV